MTDAVTAGYEPRSVRLLERWTPDDWRLKVYGIAFRAERPAPETVAAAKEVAARCLPAPATKDGRHGLGFVIVHQGQDARWLLVHWWVDQCLLYHRVFGSPLAGPSKFTPAPEQLLACTWELSVINFERDAWMETVFAHAEAPDPAAYLAREFNGSI
jgi:hypothetical protein